ncbi:DeoR/GlpR family DNA-binding transcription regulator [Microbacterium halophytorum]|uniref:DeoR/GlpR family DNA-binding transcription regulator n=1 Tax=Microbacterium halophytorum TaxID=2067568 RepID=UPI000CFE2A27|nr:DeoR/GlpR family DNA-binding transcription regulator [Microbacterium halophytorum]
MASAGPQEKRKDRQLPAGRKADLAAYVATHGQVTVAGLAEEFGVSIDTVRRDLDQLSTEGKLIRTHGGAVSNDLGAPPDQGLGVRLRIRVTEKDAIGAAAAGLVSDGSVIFVNAGTTTMAFGRHLRDHRDLTIATNSLVFPAEVPATALRELFLFGGSVRTVTQATTGPVSFRPTHGGPAMDVQADIAIIAVGAVSADGYSTSNLGDSAMMAEMMSHANKVAVLADSSKFDHRLFARIGGLEHADYFVTDREPDGRLWEALEGAGVEVVVAGAE